MYECADKIRKYLTRVIVRAFDRVKPKLAGLDELNVLSASKDLYGKLYEEIKKAYLKLARRAAKDAGEDDFVDILWVDEVLNRYDPVTGYVFTNEIERKRDRFAESVVASPQKMQAVDTGMRYLSNMVGQYTIQITDEAALKSYERQGVRRVIWISTADERRCRICRNRDGTVYDIDKVPPKPHLGCRCVLLPYKEREK